MLHIIVVDPTQINMPDLEKMAKEHEEGKIILVRYRTKYWGAVNAITVLSLTNINSYRGILNGCDVDAVNAYLKQKEEEIEEEETNATS